MSRKFTITTPTNLLRADAEGRVQAQFTAANTSGTPERRLFRAVPLGDAKESWLSLAGESERAFAADGVHQLSVTASVPPGTAAGRYGFRLDCIAASRSGDEIEEGDAVYFDYAGAEAPKKSMAWLWIAAAIVIVLGGAGAWLALRPTEAQAVPPVTATAAETAPTEKVEVADVATSQLYVADAIRKLQAVGFRTTLKFEQSEDVKPGTVTEQSVPPGDRAARGTPIELTVATLDDESMSLADADQQELSAGAVNALRAFFIGQRRVDIPNVMSQQMSAVAAIRMMQISGLRVTLREMQSTTASPGIVVSQQPDPKEEVRVGTPVTVFVAVNRNADLTLSPEEQAHLSQEGANRLTALFQSMQPPPLPGPVMADPVFPRYKILTTTSTQ